MNSDFKGFDFLYELCSDNLNFRKAIESGIENKEIRYFDDREWEKIRKQNFITPIDNMKSFYDLFSLGYNKGNCTFSSRQLSYSYNDVDIVSGVLPILKGTLNAEKEGGHCWLENRKEIIDTSLALVIDKKYKDILGYVEEQRVTKSDLLRWTNYQARKECVNDKSLKRR